MGDKFRRFRKIGLVRGVVAAFTVRLLNFTQKRRIGRGNVLLPVPHSPAWVRGRLGTTDGYAYGEVFTLDSYDCAISPRFIVDAGANVGYASVLFAERWPEAQIVALEPDASNYEMLVQNTKRYPNVRPLRAALWSDNTPLQVTGENKWALRVEQAAESDFPSVTMAELAAMSPGRIDLLKLDIEGAEHSLFVNDPHCLDAVDLLIVELHDYMVPASEALDALLATLPHRCEQRARVRYVRLGGSAADF